MADVLHVAIVGGGETARQLIIDFLSRPFISVVGVADVDENSPGALAATRAGIPFTTDLAEFGALEPRPDLVIDVCGKPHVSPVLEETFRGEGPDSPTVVHDDVARLVLSLVADSHSLAPGCDTTLPPALRV